MHSHPNVKVICIRAEESREREAGLLAGDVIPVNETHSWKVGTVVLKWVFSCKVDLWMLILWTS